MSYLSPEAARGEEVDRRADIFAVGILLYEMLTGKRLFYGETDYQTVELVRAAKHPAHRAAEPGGRAGAGGDRAQGAGPPARRSLPDARPTCRTRWRSTCSRAGLKMIQRDIAELVRGCLEEQTARRGRRAQAAHQHHRHAPAGRDPELHLGRLPGQRRGARRQGGPDLAAAAHARPGEYVDTRDWAQDARVLRPPGRGPSAARAPPLAQPAAPPAASPSTAPRPPRASSTA